VTGTECVKGPRDGCGGLKSIKRTLFSHLSNALGARTGQDAGGGGGSDGEKKNR